jgi:hypothetical protein
VKLRSFLVLLVLSLSTAASAQAPIPVVERVFTDGEVATRVTLFSNRVVVVSIAQNGVHGYFKHIALPPDQYLIYLGILQRAVEELGEKPVTSAVSTPRSQIALTLHIGPDSPRKIEFSPMATVSLPLAQISGAVNDLEHLVRESSPSSETIKGWDPKRGDRVELMVGDYARVTEVLDDGFLVLEHEDTYIREIVGPDVRDEVILRVVEREN